MMADADNTIYTCWSLSQARWRGDEADVLTHVQRPTDSRTLCGVSTKGDWDFGWTPSLEYVGCRRCRRIAERATDP